MDPSIVLCSPRSTPRLSGRSPGLFGVGCGMWRVGLRRVRPCHCTSGSDRAPNPTYTWREVRACRPRGRSCEHRLCWDAGTDLAVDQWAVGRRNATRQTCPDAGGIFFPRQCQI